MTSPLAERQWLILESAGSTQDVAAQQLAAGDAIGAVLTLDQVSGRGRFQRQWVASPGKSLAVSFIFRGYPDHPLPHLIGMAVSIAAAGVLGCQLQWPNDLVIGKKKVGGILTELNLDASGRKVPIVGLGVNLNQTEFPEEIAHRATSMFLERGTEYDPVALGRKIADRIAILPEPTSWAALEPTWALFDSTPGKHYRLHDGTEAIALSIGPDGQLLCSVDGTPQVVLAADAILG